MLIFVEQFRQCFHTLLTGNYLSFQFDVFSFEGRVLLRKFRHRSDVVTVQKCYRLRNITELRRFFQIAEFETASLCKFLSVAVEPH